MITLLALLAGLFTLSKFRSVAPPPEPDKGQSTPTVPTTATPAPAANEIPVTTSNAELASYQRYLTRWAVRAVRGYAPGHPPEGIQKSMADIAKILGLPKTQAFITANIGSYGTTKLNALSEWPYDEKWPGSDLTVMNWIRAQMYNYDAIPEKP
jgi:hypothetical protein